MLTKEDWQSALDVQDACNLSGVVHTLARIVSKIREEKDCSGTNYVNQHPIVVLYVAKLVHLSGLEYEHTSVTDAYNAICKKIEEEQTAS